MSTKIKSTLYRFVTMRAPELVEQEIVRKNFVQHPEMGKPKTSVFDSVFLKAIYKLPDNKTKKQYLKEVAATYATNAFKDRDAVRDAVKVAAGNDLYDFAIWLTANRTTLKKEDVENQINFSNGVARQAPLSSSLIATDFITLWDNLFYQIITFKSSYVREAILSVLVAEQFLKQYSNTIDSNKVLRKMAQMRIIVPNDLFSPQSNALAVASRKSTLKSLPVVNKKLSKELEYNMLDKSIASYDDALKQIDKLEKEYNSNNKKAQAFAYKQYQNNVASLYANATKADKIITYPNTTFTKTIKEYVNLEIPPFSFEPALELDLTVFRSRLNDEAYAFIASVIKDNETITTFSELKESITATLSKDVQKQFEGTKFGTAFSTTNGFVMPMVSRPDSNDPNYFAIAGSSYTNNVALTLLFNNVYQAAEVIGADYSFTFDNDTPVSSITFQEQWINGKLQVTLSNANFDFSDKSSVSVKGFLLLSNATKINFIGAAIISSNSATNSYKVLGDGTYENEALSDPIGTSGNNGTSESTNNSIPTEIPALDYIPSGYGIKRLGIADYRKVEQEVSCYVPGEISHIENVMAREYKEKSTRRLRRQEDTVTTSKEKETEKLSDTTSTDRFEMNQEVNSIIAEQNSANVGSQISWKGKVDGIAHADFAHNTSQETSNLEAITNAKEITERALERVVQKVKEERITKIIEEFEENTKHGFDNRKGNQHVSGVYRWIDKIFKNRIVNYGKRLTYEFMIPEPASFHNEASTISLENPSTEMLVKPIDPRVGIGNLKITSSKDISLLNYQKWASLYNADVSSLKEATITVGKGFNLTGNEDNFENASGNGEVRIPDGYIAYEGKIDFSAAEDDTHLNGKAFFVSLGDYSVGNISNASNKIDESFGYFSIGNFSNAVPVSFMMQDYYQGKVNVSVRCKLTEEVIEQWKTETFNTIIEAYEDQLAAYNQKIEQLKAGIKTKVKSNPLFYRQIENTVLRKNCIEYLISHNTMGEKSLITGDTVQDIHVKYDDVALETYATKVKFFEQAFEWDLMSYYFYPFYWAEKKKWKELYNVDESDDSIFRAFLQSGMARVILTVRPGFEEAVNWYMATGQVWNGGQVPTFNDELFISIIEELREPEGTVEETWESRVPTSLTVIQAGSIGLNVQGLPCDDDCSQYNQFDSDGNQMFNPDGTPVILENPIVQNLDTVQLGNITDELTTVSDSIEEIQADIEEIKTTLDTIATANN